MSFMKSLKGLADDFKDLMGDKDKDKAKEEHKHDSSRMLYTILHSEGIADSQRRRDESRRQ